jgi:hypothetical protein
MCPVSLQSYFDEISKPKLWVRLFYINRSNVNKLLPIDYVTHYLLPDNAHIAQFVNLTYDDVTHLIMTPYVANKL